MTDNYVGKLLEKAEFVLLSYAKNGVKTPLTLNSYVRLIDIFLYVYRLEVDMLQEQMNETDVRCKEFLYAEQQLLIRKSELAEKMGSNFWSIKSLSDEILLLFKDIKSRLLEIHEKQVKGEILKGISEANKVALNKIAKELQSYTGLNKISSFNSKESCLVMQGGGIWGLAYVGALLELRKYYSFTWFGGTSAGAITATLLAAGYNADELINIIRNKDFDDFLDAPTSQALINFANKEGFFPGEKFREWINELIVNKKGGLEVHKMKDFKKRLTVFANTKSRGDVVFDSYVEESQYVSSSFAVRCSMSVPILFVPQYHNGERVYDGGILTNFPIEEIRRLDTSAEILGMCFRERENPEKLKFKGVFSELFSILRRSRESATIVNNEDSTIVIDPSPISWLKFKLDELDKEYLVLAGRLAAVNYLYNSGKPIDKEYLDKLKEKVEEKRSQILGRNKADYKGKIKLGLIVLYIFFIKGIKTITYLFSLLVRKIVNFFKYKIIVYVP